MSGVVEESLDFLSSTVQMNVDYHPDRSRHILPLSVSNDSLQQLGNSLAIELPDLEEDAKNALRKVLYAIHDKSGIAIDRFCVSGSIGHQPPGSDDRFGFDITVFVDCSVYHGEPDSAHHSGCAMHAKGRIFESLHGLINIGDCAHIPSGISCSINQYSANIAVYPSLSHKMHLQRKHVWDLILATPLSPDTLWQHSIGLHESLTSFMHLGDPIHHGLVRLSRLWRKHVLLPAGCHLSAIQISLVMIRCIDDEKARGMSVSTGPTSPHSFPTLKVFTDFLSALASIESAKVSFQRFYEPELVRDQPEEPPYILDPVNPWRNLLNGAAKETLACVSRCAKQSLSKLHAAGELEKCTIARLFQLEEEVG